MVRIGGSTDRGSHIKEHDYYTPQGEFRIDKDGSPTLLNCLMYKMCYYRFGQVYTEQGKWFLRHTQLFIVDSKINEQNFTSTVVTSAINEFKPSQLNYYTSELQLWVILK